MRRVGLIALFFIGWMMIGHAAAQDSTPFAARDYVVSNAAADPASPATDDTTFAILFTVTNQGGDAVGPSEISIVDADGRNMIQGQDDVLPALKAGESQLFSYSLITSDFPPSSVQVFDIEAGIDQYELAGSPFAKNNKVSVSVQIPAIVRPPSQTQGQTPSQSSDGPSSTSDPLAQILALFPEGEMTILGATIPRTYVLALIIALVAVALWLTTVLLRSIFRRPAKMGVWQPPYGTMPTMDPNSMAGRRQAWQSHAQNGTILAAPTEGNVHPIKLLVGNDGNFMQGWRVTAVRLSQYDGYGRVGRTETIAPSSVVRRLNGVLQQNARYQGESLNKRIRPVARALVKELRRNMTKRTTHLPVAMDIRFEGRQGEVHIVFELYQCQNQAWHRLDRWEPLMTVIGRRLIENYTYTIHGQSSGETTKEFFVRLPEDVEWLLCETLRSRAVPAADAPPPPPQTYETPDTVSGMQPVVDRPR